MSSSLRRKMRGGCARSFRNCMPPQGTTSQRFALTGLMICGIHQAARPGEEQAVEERLGP